ncbi:hypothetical protein KP509_13G092100 [Ceratopteris richardii]|nr:hypothetical protein KP509_13G092100 [Ceratopteris richardii]
MSLVDSNGVFLESWSSSFQLGLYTVTDQSAVYLNIVHKPSHKVVWTANRDSPATPSDELHFLPSGNIKLLSANGSTVLWSSQTRGATKIQLRENGNLVLLDARNQTLWQTFDHPTDTLLTGQVLGEGVIRLVSSMSDTSSSSGPYSLSLESGDLRLLFSSNPQTRLPYWSMSRDPRLVTLKSGVSSRFAVLNNTGLSLIMDNFDKVSIITWSSRAVLTRATLENDGNLRIYTFSNNVWVLLIVAVMEDCQLPLFCGPLGLCNNGHCTCPGSLQPVSNSNITQGCRLPSTAPACSNSSYVEALYQKIGEGFDYFTITYIQSTIITELDACKSRCSEECGCTFLFFQSRTNTCYIFHELGTLQYTGKQGDALYVRTNGESDAPTGVSQEHGLERDTKFPLAAVIGIVGSSVVVIVVMIATYIRCFVRKCTPVHESNGTSFDDNECFDYSSGPTKFSFQDLQQATHNFSKELGKGGFSTVYEGILADQTRVAVKVLENMEHQRDIFHTEIAIIASIHHWNLVKLHGYCADGAHKLLVYEFMAKGSLQNWLFQEGQDTEFLDWNTRHKIALGTARGLAYLHHGCRETIIHCDVKAENILLDENYDAKISDFGLAKLLTEKQNQMLTTMRGTRGYLAPEWRFNLPISEKSDVYSFGIVLLEIISGRKNYEPSEMSERRYLAAFAFALAECNQLEELLDNRLRDSVSNDKVKETVIIALLCIQEEISLRPSMTEVVRMLEGNINVSKLPSSFVLTERLHMSMMDASMASPARSSTSSPEIFESRALLSHAKYHVS